MSKIVKINEKKFIFNVALKGVMSQIAVELVDILMTPCLKINIYKFWFRKLFYNNAIIGSVSVVTIQK